MLRTTVLRRQIQRLLLALVTVAASFAYLTRAQPSGVMLGMTIPGSSAGMATMPGMTMDADVHAPAEMEARPAGHAVDRSVAHPVPAARAALLTDAAPNAPPTSHHDTAAHCPFCFTAAFALEAAVAAVLRPAVQWPWRLLDAYVRPHVLATRHADARAPPLPA